MFIREDAIELTKDLAVKGLSKRKIKKELEKQGMAGLLREDELDAIMIEAGCARELKGKSPGTLICRIVGGIALAVGLLGGGLNLLTFFGVILIVAPELGNEKVRPWRDWRD